MRWWFGLMAFITLSYACTQHGRKVEPAFYYWKTVYQADDTEQSDASGLGARGPVVRIMDLANHGRDGEQIAVAPVVSQVTSPDSFPQVPVMFTANQAVDGRTEAEPAGLAGQ